MHTAVIVCHVIEHIVDNGSLKFWSIRQREVKSTILQE